MSHWEYSGYSSAAESPLELHYGYVVGHIVRFHPNLRNVKSSSLQLDLHLGERNRAERARSGSREGGRITAMLFIG